MESFLRGLQQGTSARDRFLPDEQQQPAPPSNNFLTGLQAGMGVAQGTGSAFAPPEPATTEPVQPQAPSPFTAPADIFGRGARVGTAAAAPSPLEQLGPIQGPPSGMAPTLETEVTWEEKPDGGILYHNFPQGDITIEQMSPSLVWTMQDRGYDNRIIRDYIFGVRYKRRFDENGNAVLDQNGNEIWDYNPESEWTEADHQMHQVAMNEMGNVNGNLQAMRTEAQENGWDFSSPQERWADGREQVPGMATDGMMGPVLGGLDKVFVQPTEWMQNTGADTWYRQNILGEDVSFRDSLVEFTVGGGSGLGNLGGSILGLVTPGTENSELTAEGFDDWASKQDPELLRRLYEDGWDYDNDGVADVTGGNALWDAYASTRTNSQKLGIDTLTDPWTAVPLGGALSRGTGKAIVNAGAGNVATNVIGRSLDNIGRGAIAADDAIGAIFMKPIAGTAKAVVRAPGDILDTGYRGARKILSPGTDLMAETPISRMRDDIGTGWAEGTTRPTVDAMQRQLEIDRQPEIPEIREGWGMSGQDPLDPQARNIWSPERLEEEIPQESRLFNTTRDVGSVVSSRRMKRLASDLSSDHQALLRQMDYQREAEAGTGTNQTLEQTGRRDPNGLAERERNTILAMNNSEEQKRLHRVAVGDGLDQTIPTRKSRMSSQQLRREQEDVWRTRDSADVERRRQDAMNAYQDVHDAIPPTVVDQNMDIETLENQLGYLAPERVDKSSPTRARRVGGKQRSQKYRIDEIADMFANDPEKYRTFLANYRDVVASFREAGLIAPEKTMRGEFTSPTQAAWSQIAIEEAWRRAFRGTPVESALPSYKPKMYSPKDPQYNRAAAGDFSVARAFEAIVNMGPSEAQRGYLYLHRMGFADFAEDAEALRFAKNWIFEQDGDGGSGSFVFRNQSTDRYFTHDDLTRAWNPRRERSAYWDRTHTRVFPGKTVEHDFDKAAQAADAWDGSGFSRTDRPGTATYGNVGPEAPPMQGPEPMPMQGPEALRTQGPWAPQVGETPLALPDRILGTAPGEGTVGEAIVETLSDPELEDHLARIRAKLYDESADWADEPVEVIPDVARRPEAVDAEKPKKKPTRPGRKRGRTVKVDTARKPQEPDRVEAPAQEPEAVYGPHESLGVKDYGPEALADAGDRIDKLVLRGLVDVEQIAKWRSQGLDSVQVFRRLSHEAQRGTPHPDAQMIYDLSTPLAKIPRRGLDYAMPQREFNNTVKEILEAASRNDSLTLSDDVLTRIRELAPEGDEIRSLFTRSLSSLTSDRSRWDPDLVHMLHAMGVDFESDLARRGRSFSGYTLDVPDARIRLSSVARAVVAGHYMAKMKDPAAIVELLRSSLPDIDRLVDDFLEIATNRDRIRNGAKTYLDTIVVGGRTVRKQLSVDPDTLQIRWTSPEGVDMEFPSWERAASYFRRVYGDGAGEIVPVNDMESAIAGSRTALVDVDPESGKTVDLVDTNSLNWLNDISDWDDTRIAQAEFSVRESLREYHNANGTWGITSATSQEEFLERAGKQFNEAIYARAQATVGPRPLDHSIKQAGDELYKEAREVVARMERAQRIIDIDLNRRRNDTARAKGETPAERPDDVRDIKNKTTMQQRQASLLDFDDEVSRQRQRALNKNQSWIDKYTAEGKDVPQSLLDEREQILRKYEVNKSVDRYGNVLLTGSDAHRNNILVAARGLNARIRKSKAIRSKYGRHLTDSEDADIALVTGTVQQIRKRLEGYDQLLKEWEAADYLYGVRSSNDDNRRAWGKRRDELEQQLIGINNESGMADGWNKIVKILTDADNALIERIEKSIRQAERTYKQLKADIEAGPSKGRHQRLQALEEQYRGKDKVKSGKRVIRGGEAEKTNGIIPDLEEEIRTIRSYMGYRGDERDPARIYPDLQLSLGRIFATGEYAREAGLIRLADDAAKAFRADQRNIDSSIRTMARMGGDLDADESARLLELEQLDAEQDLQRPGDTILVSSQAEQFDMSLDPQDRYENLSPLGDLAGLREEARTIYSELEAAGQLGGARYRDIYLMVEETRMKAHGYVKAGESLYLPLEHQVVREAEFQGAGADIKVTLGNGKVYTDINDFLDDYPEVVADRVTGAEHLFRKEHAITYGQELSFEDQISRGSNTQAPDSFDDEYLFADGTASPVDRELYANYMKVAKMGTEELLDHVSSSIGRLLEEGDEAAVTAFYNGLKRAEAAHYGLAGRSISESGDPVDNAALSVLYNVVLNNFRNMGRRPSELNPKELVAVLRTQSFRDAAYQYMDPQHLALPKWAGVDTSQRPNAADLYDIDVEDQVRRAKARDAADVMGEINAENPTAASHRVREQAPPQQPEYPHPGQRPAHANAPQQKPGAPGVRPKIRRDTNQATDPGLKFVKPGKQGSGVVNSTDLEVAHRTLDSSASKGLLDPNQGFVFKTPLQRATDERKAREWAEQVILDDIHKAADNRFKRENLQQQFEDNVRVRQGTNTQVGPPEFRKLRDVQRQDNYLLNADQLAVANTKLTRPGYFQGFTIHEAWRSIYGKNKYLLEKYRDLYNKQLRHGSLSLDEQRELERIGTRFENYGAVLKLNQGRGGKARVKSGVNPATTRPAEPTTIVDDMRTFLLEEEFPLELISRRELEDVIFNDLNGDLLPPRWAGVVDKYDRFVSAWSKWKLMNPLNIMRFMSLNMIGDYGQMLGMGHADAVAYSLRSMLPRDMNIFSREARKRIKDGSWRPEITSLIRETGSGARGDIADTQYGEFLQNAGIGPNVTRIQGSMVSVLSKHADTRVRGVMDNGELEPLLARGGSKFKDAYENVLHFSTALEWNRRYALFHVDIQRRMRARHADLNVTVLERAGAMGIDGIDPRELNIVLKEAGWGASSQKIYDDLMKLGAARSSADTKELKKWAERVGRDWANSQKLAMDEAVATVNKTLFSYEMTDMDQLVRKVIPFHYWATRAIPLYAEIALRNPYLISAYFRATNAMEREKEMGNTPGFMDNVMQFWMSPAGYMSFTNPLSAIGLISMFSDSMKSQGADGESVLGMWTRLFGDYGGVNLYPWFSSAMNMTGWMGNTNRGLDPTGFSRERRFFGSVVQWMAAEGMLPMDQELLGKPFEQRLREGREIISGIIPGGATIEATDANAPNLVSFQYILENVIRERDGLGETEPLNASQQEEIVFALDNPDDPLYQQGLEIYSNGNLWVSVTNSMSPVYLNIQPANASKLEHTADMDQPLPPGVLPPPGEHDPLLGAPNEADKQWMDTWRRSTGKEYEEGDLDRWKSDTKLREDLLWLTPEAQQLVIWEYQHDTLGTPQQQKVLDTYNRIGWGDLEGTGVIAIGGNEIPYGVVNAMAPEERRQLREQWLKDKPERESDYKNVLSLQKSFRKKTPGLDEYMQWQNSHYQYGSKSEFRAHLIATNPNAARYFAAERRELVEQYGTDIEKINEVLDMRTTTKEAYFAVHGHQYSLTDTAPLPTSSGSFDPIAAPREGVPTGSVSDANDYLTKEFGTTVDLHTLPQYLVDTMIPMLPPELQEPVRSELRS